MFPSLTFSDMTVVTGSLAFSSYPARQFRIGVAYQPRLLAFPIHYVVTLQYTLTVYLLNYVLQ